MTAAIAARSERSGLAERLGTLVRRIDTNAVKFGVVFAVVNLHTLLGLSAIGYSALYVVVCGLVLLELAVRLRAGLTRLDQLTPALVWVGVALYGLAVSVLLISASGAAYGFARFIFALPVFVALVVFTRDSTDLRRHLLFAVVFFAVASLTIPLQLVTGPIAWFDISSERAGLERYSSLVGNLTAVGVVVGVYVVLAQVLKPVFRIAALVSIAVPAMLSLQKSAYANLAIGIVILIVLNYRHWRGILVTVGAAAAGGAAVFAFSPVVQERVLVALISIGILPPPAGQPAVDIPLLDSLVQRLVTLPAANFAALAELHSPFVYLTGGGYGMASTALVPTGDALAPMAHNQFAELLTVFGPIGALALVAVLAVVGTRLVRGLRGSPSVERAVVTVSFGLLMVNSLFANGTLYQPAAASILFFALFLAFSSIDRVPRLDRPLLETP